MYAFPGPLKTPFVARPFFHCEAGEPVINTRDAALPRLSSETPNMTSFDDREDKYEKKFAHDATLRFKAEARRNKLLGLWAAGLMGKEGADAEAYAKEVIKSDFEEAGDDDVFRKLKGDFEAKGVDLSDHQIRREMDSLLAVARKQIQTEG